MLNFSGWDIAILLVAAYISVVALVRLMRRRRDEIVARYQLQVAAAQQRRRADERREKQRQVREQQVREQHTRAPGLPQEPEKPAA